MYKNSKKEDLVKVAFEIDIEVPENATLAKIKELIESSKAYTSDNEFVKNLIVQTVDERKSHEEYELAKLEIERNKLQIEKSKLEAEKIKLTQIERQIELAAAQNTTGSHHNLSRSSETDDTPNIENLIRSVKTLSMPTPCRPENYSLFFQSLERAFTTKHVPDESKSEILINILGEKASHVLLNVSDDDIQDYEKVKNAVLRQFQPTPLDCLINFRRSQRLADESHTQFAARLTTTFGYNCKIRKVNDFNTLCQLMVSDKLYSTLDRQTQSYIAVAQGEEWLKPNDLAQKCDVYYTSQRKSLSEANHRQQSNNTQSYRNGNSNRNYYNNNRFPRSPNTRPQNNYRSQQSQNDRSRNDETNVSKITTESFRRDKFYNDLQYEDLIYNGQKTKALVDSGCKILCIKSCLVSPRTKYNGEIHLIGAFGERQKAKLTEIQLAHPITNIPVTLNAAVCNKLNSKIIIPPNVFNIILHAKIQNISLSTPTHEENAAPSTENQNKSVSSKQTPAPLLTKVLKIDQLTSSNSNPNEKRTLFVNGLENKTTLNMTESFDYFPTPEEEEKK